MQKIRLELTRPHIAQQAVITTAARFNAVVCGRRWGKTVLGIDRIIERALNTGKPVAWFAPYYKLGAPVWRELQERLRPVITKSNEQEKRLEFYGGSSLEMWSLDSSDAGRGRAYACIVVDEAALIADLEQAWQESLRPMLTDYQGSAWFLSTPKGIANYFHALYQRGQAKEEGWASWSQPTSANPYIEPKEIALAKNDLTDLAFAQEYLAQFVSWAGAVFRRIQDAVHDHSSEPGGIIGVDWGRTGDYTVFVALSAHGHVVAIDRFRGLEYSLQRARLQAFRERWAIGSWIVAEQNSIGGPVVEQLQADGLPVVGFLTTHMSKSAIIESLALAFERGIIHIPNEPALIGELQAFEAKPMSSGGMRYGAPSGVHDDCVMALAIAWHGLTGPREQREVVSSASGYQISPI